MLVKAYSRTTITAVWLLNVFTIPSAMILSCLILKLKYSSVHYIALVLSFLTVAITVVNDILTQEEAIRFDGSALLGDLLSLAGAFFIAMSNVLQEFILAKQT